MKKGINEIFFQNKHVTILTLRRKSGADMYCTLSTSKYDLVKMHRWYANKGFNTFYCVAHISNSKGIRTLLKMHKILLTSELVDHVDRDGLNNQTHNLRPCTRSQNASNRGILSNNTSGHRGVFWNKETNRWRALVRVNYKMKHLGYFENIKEACKTVEEARKRYFGDFS